MSYIKTLVLLATLGWSLGAVGQQANANGKWVGTTPSVAGGDDINIEVTINDSAGTWMPAASGRVGRVNPCFKKEYPLTVSGDPAVALELDVKGSSALAGCPDFVVRLKRVDDKTFDGLVGTQERPIRLTRR